MEGSPSICLEQMAVAVASERFFGGFLPVSYSTQCCVKCRHPYTSTTQKKISRVVPVGLFFGHILQVARIEIITRNLETGVERQDIWILKQFAEMDVPPRRVMCIASGLYSLTSSPETNVVHNMITIRLDPN